jgi:hypothetical protein
MPVDFSAFSKDLDRLVEEAGARTDDQLAGKMATVTRLNDEEIKELFPEPADVRRLGELMAIVKGAQDRNDKITSLVGNAERFGGIILTLLGKLA